MAFDRAYDPIVDDLNARLRHATPQEILREAFEAYPRKIALVSSFGAESAVLLHMAAKIDPSIPVLFLDTGQLFGQTLDYRKNLAARLGLTDVRDLRPAFADLAVKDPKAGPLENRHRGVLRNSQGLAAGPRPASGVRRLDHRP